MTNLVKLIVSVVGLAALPVLFSQYTSRAPEEKRSLY